MSRLTELLVGASPRWLVGLASRAKAESRNKLAARHFGPLVATLLPDATGHDLIVANDDAVVIRVDYAERPSNVLKVATTELAAELLAAEWAALDELAQRTSLGQWRDLVAALDERGDYEDGTWFTQSALEGTPTSQVTVDTEVLIRGAIEALKPLHLATTRPVMADDGVLDELITEPIDTIRAWRPALGEDLAVINGECRQRLASLELQISRQHGDYAPSNVLWNVETESVTGIVDWRLGMELLPPEVDYVHFALALLVDRRRIEYGTAVIALLGDGATAAQASPVRLANELGPNSFDLRTAVTLAWLQHVSFGLHKARELRANPIWLNNNVDAVIKALRPPAAAAER